MITFIVLFAFPLDLVKSYNFKQLLDFRTYLKNRWEMKLKNYHLLPSETIGCTREKIQNGKSLVLQFQINYREKISGPILDNENKDRFLKQKLKKGLNKKKRRRN